MLSCRPLKASPSADPRPQPFWPVDALELAETSQGCSLDKLTHISLVGGGQYKSVSHS